MAVDKRAKKTAGAKVGGKRKKEDSEEEGESDDDDIEGLKEEDDMSDVDDDDEVDTGLEAARSFVFLLFCSVQKEVVCLLYAYTELFSTLRILLNQRKRTTKSSISIEDLMKKAMRTIWKMTLVLEKNQTTKKRAQKVSPWTTSK